MTEQGEHRNIAASLSRRSALLQKALVLGLALFSFNVFAQTSGYYFEGLAGVTRVDFNFFNPYSNVEDTGAQYGITAGLRFNDNFAFEASYLQQGTYTSTLSPTLFSDTPDLYASAQSQILGFSALGSWPVTRRAYAFGRLGIGWFDVEANYVVSDTGTLFEGDDTDVTLFVGFGGYYRFTRQYAVKVEYQRFWHDTWVFREAFTLDSLVLGVRYYF